MFYAQLTAKAKHNVLRLHKYNFDSLLRIYLNFFLIVELGKEKKKIKKEVELLGGHTLGR